jgi:hypothetical protein
MSRLALCLVPRLRRYLRLITVCAAVRSGSKARVSIARVTAIGGFAGFITIVLTVVLVQSTSETVVAVVASAAIKVIMVELLRIFLKRGMPSRWMKARGAISGPGWWYAMGYRLSISATRIIQ